MMSSTSGEALHVERSEFDPFALEGAPRYAEPSGATRPRRPRKRADTLAFVKP